MKRSRRPAARRAERPAGTKRPSTGRDSGFSQRVSPAGGPWWRHPALGAALIGVLLYLSTVTFSYVWDDHPLIEQNLLLRGGASLLRQLGSDFWLTSGVNTSGFWRPLISLTYAVDGALWQWRPAGATKQASR